MADVKLRIVGEDQASAAFASADKSLGGFSSSVTEMQSKLQVAGQAIDIFAGVFEQAFAVGKQGAVFRQTTDSFDGLIDKTGAYNDLLDRLRTASAGTVDDLTLMSSTLTLAAGAEDTFAQSLMNATPDLMEMAKAANKLNPTLGDTAYLYESISTGIKRGSPMILDNLGITVRLEEAYAKFAETLNVEASELDSTQQKQALLNEVMDKGRILIEQAGGAAGAATDPFIRLEASTTNLKNRISAELVPVLADAAGALETMMNWSNQLDAVLAKHSGEVLDNAATYAEYNAEMIRAAEAAGRMVDSEGNLIAVRKDGGRVYKDVIQSGYMLSEAQWEGQKSALAAATAAAGIVDVNESLRQSNVIAAESTTAESAATAEGTAKKVEAQKVTVELAKVLEKLSSETITAAVEQYGNLNLAIIGNMQQMNAAGLSAQAYNGKLTALGLTLADLSSKYGVVGGASSSLMGGSPSGGGGGSVGGGVSLAINYQPVLSTADSYQLQQILTPIVNNITAGK